MDAEKGLIVFMNLIMACLLGDFRGQKSLTFKKHILKHVNKNPQEESCGIIYCDINKIKYEPVENISPNKFNSFLIDKKIFAEFNSKEILSIFHSHLKDQKLQAKKIR